MRTPRLRRQAARFGLLAALSLALYGCSSSAKLRGQAEQVRAMTDAIESRAYRCAPRELAEARANTEFGLYELEQGDFVRAGKHLTQAEVNAKAADKLSDFDQCKDQQVAINIDATPRVEVVELKPQPKDRDGDGLLDDADQCPDEPEDFDGFEDQDGCLDLDNDQDGVPDAQDQCPDEPEDKDGFQDEDGCPDLDNDGDGILDINDQCPLEAEDFDGFQDDDGCPDTDNDGDGILDVNDQCPNEPENYNGNQDEDGCPDEDYKRIKVEDEQIRLNEQVFFRTNKSTIMPVSYPLLDEVADVLVKNPQISVRVEGHTDDRGSAKLNKKLSQDRADSVRKYLAGRGVSLDRMEAIGYGKDRPIEDNTTEAGRAANRRVEIHITKR